MVKTLGKTLTLVSLGGFVLHMMSRYGLIDFSLIVAAITRGGLYVSLIVVMLALMYFLLMFRYVIVARIFGVQCRTREMMAATFVSVAIGQWAPGSLAVMEMIRLSLMFGSDKKAGVHGARSALLVASLYDRLIGFFVYLVLGFAGAVTLFIINSRATAASNVMLPILLLSLVSLSGALGIFSLPYVARAAFAQRMLSGLTLYLQEKSGRHRFAAIAAVVTTKIDAMRGILAAGASKIGSLTSPALLTALTGILSYFVLYLSSLSMDHPVPLLAIVIVTPLMALSQLLPLGFAGMGGYQLITVILFNLLAADSRAAASANLLQNALSLLVSTLLGLAFVKVSYGQLLAVFRHPVSENKSG